jgi:hypothetical protein
MDNRMRSDALRTRLNTVRGEAITVRTAVRTNSDTVRTDANSATETRAIDLVRAVMHDLRRSQKETALAAGCTESELSEALNGRQGRRFDAQWIWNQDDAFLRQFLDRVADARGLSPETALVAEVEIITALFGKIVALLARRAA